MFGDVAASLEGRIAKGSKVYCEGSIRLNNWQSGQGEARSGLSISAKRCDLIGAIGRQRAATGATAPTARQKAEAAFAPAGAGKPFDDELPF